MNCFSWIAFVPVLFALTQTGIPEIVSSDFAVLLFSKTNSYRHASIEAGQKAIQELGSKNGFHVEVSEDSTMFTESTLSKFRVVVFLNTSGNVLGATQQVAFEKFIQKGGGFVGIHSAADTEYDWPWYGKLVGGYFDGHPNNPNVREATVRVVDMQHIACRHLPAKWVRQDEWYNFRDMNAGIQVLCDLDESSYEGGTHGSSHPIAWFHEYDGGRSFYTGFGHTPETFSEPLFLQHLLGGILYASGNSSK